MTPALGGHIGQRICVVYAWYALLYSSSVIPEGGTTFVTINHINFFNNMFEVGKWERDIRCFVNLTAFTGIKRKGENITILLVKCTTNLNWI